MNISSWMTDNIVLKRFVGISGNGDKKFEEIQIKARIERKDKITRTIAGNVIVGAGTIITMYKCNNEDTFIYEDYEYRIVSINEFKGKNGVVNHYEGVFV